jgi:nucleoside-diphosphate-sugar epimerase
MKQPVVVLTGGTGLIGRGLIAAMAAANEVHCITRAPDESKDAVWHVHDLAQAGEPRGLPERADAVVYLAQSEFFRDFPKRSGDIFQVNTVGLLRLLDYARTARCRKFVYGSSGGLYGTSERPIAETAPVATDSALGFYLVSKLCSEMLVRAYSPFFETVILRYFFVYGPGQRRSMLVPRLVDRVRAGQPIVLHGADGIRITPTYVTDAVAATVRAVGIRGSHTINVAGPDMVSMRELATIIGSAVGREPRFSWSDMPAGHLVADTGRMREVLGAPKVGFADGLQRMLEGAHEQ